VTVASEEEPSLNFGRVDFNAMRELFLLRDSKSVKRRDYASSATRRAIVSFTLLVAGVEGQGAG
jgi:hypothetical protein